MGRRRRRRRRARAAVLTAIGVLVLARVRALPETRRITGVASSPRTWLELAALLAVVSAVLLTAAARRRSAARKRQREELYDQSCLAAADAMTGPQFEAYVATLLSVGGYQDVRVVGGAGDGGADILAADPHRRLVAVQCKRQTARVPVSIVRQLNGSLAKEHAGRAGLLVTTAWLTGPACDLAARTGITVVDRDSLAIWMGSARLALERQQAGADATAAPDGTAAPARRPLRPAARGWRWHAPARALARPRRSVRSSLGRPGPGPRRAGPRAPVRRAEPVGEFGQHRCPTMSKDSSGSLHDLSRSAGATQPEDKDARQ